METVFRDWACLLLAFVLLGCTSGRTLDTQGPSMAEVQADSAAGPKARIAVAQFINNSGGLEARLQRIAIQHRTQMAQINRSMMERQRMMIPYMHEMNLWQARVQELGEDQAGPPPEPPRMKPVTSSPYTVSVTDPIAGGIRDLMIKALFNSGRYIVLERQEIEAVNWEQEFSRRARVGQEVDLPGSRLEGAELLVIGSLNTLDLNGSGLDIGGYFDVLTSSVIPQAYQSYAEYLPYLEEASKARVQIKSAKAALELRVVDTWTSRVVAATTVEGSARSFGFGAAKSSYSYNAGELPTGITFYHDTPVEKAFREMVDAAVAFLIEKTPERYYHQPEPGPDSGPGSL